jgi:hypothetical protein
MGARLLTPAGTLGVALVAGSNERRQTCNSLEIHWEIILQIC